MYNHQSRSRFMRPATFEPQQIIEAGLALQAEGRNITGFALRNRVGGGNPGHIEITRIMAAVQVHSVFC